MPCFIVIGRDGSDDGALSRRLSVRQKHLDLSDDYKDRGHLLMAIALKDDQDKMIGSVMLFDFDSRADLDMWLKEEPYVTGDVWRDIEVYPAAVGASFEEMLSVS